MGMFDNFRTKPTFVPEGASDQASSSDSHNGEVPPLPRDLEQHVVYRRTSGDFGLVAIALKLLDLQQVEDIKRVQAERGGTPGEVACELGLLTREQVDRAANAHALDVHVDGRHNASSAFLTWLRDLEKLGIVTLIKRVTAQQLEALRQEHATDTARGDADLETLTLARRVFADAAAIGATDITVLIRETHAEVQMRVKGDNKLADSLTMRREEGQALIRSIYTGLATTKAASFIPQEFQDAQIHGDQFPGSGLSSVRILRGPAYPDDNGGGFLIARLQYRKQAMRKEKPSRSLVLKPNYKPAGEFDVPGFTALQKTLIERLVRLPMGVVAITGPTGSGKTTTLFELMKYQARLAPQKRQITIENPPEYPMSWAIQLSAVNEDFREYVRYALRMDPDTILLGEVRGADEGVAALQAAMTGHFVWTTLHVTDPYKALTRLEMLDRDRLSFQVLCDHELIVGLVAQRVLPLLCPHCACSISALDKKEALPDFMIDALRTWGDLSSVRVRGNGCDECHGDGIIGREAVAEIVITSSEFMRDVLQHGLSIARHNHRMRPGSDKSMLANAMDRVFTGEIDPRDVHDGVQELQAKGDGV
ncbi:ATPase, T2SS/T4P/T4SS family [Caballeronia sp. LP003]|uniref:ATPase, T2SS/T4P/T4SS family n=1 Tax=Caballeronia sp. LP003 TaxID=3038551 RepID=UPI00285E0394|nr:ATPase, T2SS/T4P/T4SS family [Caballeronia sp. LP003]MDR5791733.1 ATPase, T2SS/T4P/T4SS family [Caballeronia sp. LP003]